MLHGWIMEVTPGSGEPGDYELTWRVYTTKREGIETVASQISDYWTWQRLDFTWGEDLQDYLGLHGIVAFVRINEKREVPVVWLGKHQIQNAFVFCGSLRGEAIPFHTEEHAYEIIEWFINKQEDWHAIYSKSSDSETEEDAKTSASYAGSRAPQRATRKVVH